MVTAFIVDHKDRFGVEPICRTLSRHGVQIAPSAYYAAKARPPSAREVRDVGLLMEEIQRVFHDRNMGRGQATGKGCGVLVARRPGYSWASPSSIGSW